MFLMHNFCSHSNKWNHGNHLPIAVFCHITQIANKLIVLGGKNLHHCMASTNCYKLHPMYHDAVMIIVTNYYLTYHEYY